MHARLRRWHSGWWRVLFHQARGTCKWFAFVTEATIKLRLMEQSLRLLHGARRRPTQGACSSLPLALRLVEVTCWQTPGTRHLQVICLCNGSRNEAPIKTLITL